MVFLLLCGVSGLLASCTAVENKPTERPVETAITVTDAWIRPGIDPTAVYMTITNTGDRPITLAAASAAWAQSVGIHQTVDQDGFMVMEHADSITVPAHGTVVLRPGGYHLMAEGIDSKIGAGDSVDLEFTTGDARRIPVTAEARPVG